MLYLVLTYLSGTSSSYLRGWRATPQLKAQNCAHWTQRETHLKLGQISDGSLCKYFSLKRPDAYVDSSNAQIKPRNNL